MGRTYGYARVSSTEQNLGRQIEALLKYGVEERDIVTDKQSGKDFQRKGYLALKNQMLRPGDTLVIKEMDRLGRDYGTIKDEWLDIQRMGVDIVIIDTPILNTKEKSDLEKNLICSIVFELLAYTAEKERRKIRIRQSEGIRLALDKGVKFGRPETTLPDNYAEVIDLWQSNQITAVEAMKHLGMKKNNNTSELDDLLANVEDIDFVFEDDTISDTDESDESEEDDLPEDFFDDDSEENDLYEPDGTPKKHPFVVGDKVMTSIFPERFFDSDYEMNTNEKLYIIDCSKEWAQARQEYDNLMEEYYLRTEKANQLTESNNPPYFEVRDEPADKVARIKYRFSSILGDFDKSNTDTIFKDYPVDISRECVSNVIFDKIKSRDIKIRNPLKITGLIEDTAFSYWAVKPIIYHRKVNGRDELFNYYEIYTRNNVRCVICPPQSLKKVLESSGSDYDYSMISRQIIESEKIFQPESVERSFAFRWFRNMLPINETTALSDAETEILVGLPRGTQKLIFSILGYSVLSMFVPDMGEYDEPPKVVAGNIVAQPSQVKDIISAVSACFVSAGGSDLIKPKYLSLKPDESLNSQNCERRLIVIDTTGMRGRNKEQKLFQTILDDYIRYAEQKIVPVAYPDIGWLPLVISTEERDERFYNIDIQSADLSMVTEVTTVLRKLYRNALVGISESGFTRLRETVIAWADEKVTERNATGAYSSRY